MNQAELIDAIQKHNSNSGTGKTAIKEMLDGLAAVAHRELGKGGEVPLPGLGKLSIKASAARKGRNPSTGEEIDIAAKNVPKFSAAKALKDAVAS